MIHWCNDNQGFLMVLLTGIYVIATIVICIYNQKAIDAQKKISKVQNHISLFSLRYEVFRTIQDELHFWRFTSNDQVVDFWELKDKVDVKLRLATHCQNIYYLSEKTSLVFDDEISNRLDRAWAIIKTDIYPILSDLVMNVPPSTSAPEILVLIKKEMEKPSLKDSKNKLIVLELDITSMIEEYTRLNNLQLK